MMDPISKKKNNPMLICSMVLALMACCTLFSTASMGQAYPNRVIRLIVPYPPGGGTDILTRKLAEGLEKELGQTVIVDNRSGANGIIGTKAVASAPPDGYTVLATTIAAHAANPLMYKELPYDSIKDFAPVSSFVLTPLVLVVNPAFPAKSVTDLVQLARRKPGAISYASWGIGGMSHLAGEMLKMSEKINMLHVPYKGGGPALIAVVSGEVPVYFAGITEVIPFVQSGKLRAIAVSGVHRSKVMPDVPTVSETPGFEHFEATVETALWVRTGTPNKIVQKLNSAVVSVTRSPEFRNWVETKGNEPIGDTPDEMLSTIKQEIKKLGRVIDATGISPK